MNALLRDLPAALPLLSTRDLARIAAVLDHAGLATQAQACQAELHRRRHHAA